MAHLHPRPAQWHSAVKGGVQGQHLSPFDECRETFTVEHGLQCKTGGLIGLRHDDGCGEWGDLGKQATSTSAVTHEPAIYSGVGKLGKEKGKAWVPKEDRGDMTIHGFWKQGTATVFDIPITSLDAKIHCTRDTKKVLEVMEKEKKDNYLESCLKHRHHFTPLMYSADSMPGEEAAVAEKQMVSLLVVKLDQEYSEMCRFVHSRIAMAIVRSNTLLLRGTQGAGCCLRH
eukprot:5503127-Ditylum_brightwellii.AAC.1